MFNEQTLAAACLAPSARHLCSIGPGTVSSSVRSGIFCPSRKMSLRTELVFSYAHETTYMPALTDFRLRRSLRQGGRPQGPFKIKNLPTNPSEKPSNSIKVNQGFFPQKKSEFFPRPISQNIGQILQKRPKKRCPNALKMMQFLTCWQHALTIQNFKETPHFRNLNAATRHPCRLKSFVPFVYFVVQSPGAT